MLSVISTGDWSIGEPGGATLASVHAELEKWYSGPKSPGLIILEHELTDNTVTAFMDSWSLIQSNGWKAVSVAELDGESAYQNADGDDGSVTPANGIVLSGASSAGNSSVSAASSGSTSTAGSASGNASSSSTYTSDASASASSAANSLVSSGTSSASVATGIPGSGSKQVNVTISSSSAPSSTHTGSSSATAASATTSAQVKQQESGASSFVQMAFWDIRALVAAFATLFVSAFALA